MRRKTTVKRSAGRNGGSIVEKIALNLEYLLYMTRKLLSNIRGEGWIPDGVIKTIARAVLADAGAFFATEEGRAAFEKWKKEREEQRKAKEQSDQCKFPERIQPTEKKEKKAG